MSAPGIFVILPGLMGFLTAVLKSRVRWLEPVSAALAGVLAVAAFLLPVDAPLIFRGAVLQVQPSLSLLGRSLVIDAGLLEVVGAIYGAAFLWFTAALFVSPGGYFISFGLLAVSILVSAVSVQPWGFVGILFLFAIFMCVPLMVPPGSPWKQSVMNFLGFQVLGVLFLLIAGAMIRGLETTPPGLRIVERPSIFLGLGFALILGLFPFHAWMPRLVEEVNPFAAAFILAVLPSFAGLLFLQVVDQHVWLRSSEEMFTLLRTIGMVTAGLGGLLAAFQRNLGRILGFGALVETGVILLAIGSGPQTAAGLFFPLLVSRGLGFMVWGAGLAAAKVKYRELDFRAVQGLIRKDRIIGLAILAGTFSSAGLPVLMGFVSRIRLYAVLSPEAPTAAFAVWLASLGLLFISTRTLAVLVMHPDAVGEPTEAPQPDTVAGHHPLRDGWILAACLILLLAGIFPAWVREVAEILPLAFEHLRP